MADRDPNQERQDHNVEEPGDTNAADIVGRTGEEMPRQSHDGIEADVRHPLPDTGQGDGDVDGYPV